MRNTSRKRIEFRGQNLGCKYCPRFWSSSDLRTGRIDRHFHDKTLQSALRAAASLFTTDRATELATCGIGIHHAGMTLDDRRITEEFFLQKRFKVILSTSVRELSVRSFWILPMSSEDVSRGGQYA